jgi:two-component SAPR family response regulator
LTEFKEVIFIGTLAAAYAEAGRFPEAITTAQRAIALAEDKKESGLAETNRKLLAQYREGKAYREVRENN